MAEEQGERYLVVLNDEEQYSIWWADREVPAGWRSEGPAGTREECLARIGELWTDMRPLSLRIRMAQAAQDAPAQNAPAQRRDTNDNAARGA